MLTHTEASTAASANSQIKIGEGSAYAKCILSGEHFVVYGQPALVMSLDKKISIKAVIELEDNIKLNNKLNNNKKINISDIKYSIEQRFSGELKSIESGVLGDFIKAPSLQAQDTGNPPQSLRDMLEANIPPQSLRAYGEATPGDARTPLIYHALINALHTKLNKISNIKKIRLIINSEIPQSRGYGSSASVLTALIKALNNAFNLRLSNEDIFTWVHKMECYQHGKSSGVDPMIAILGGVLFLKPTNPADPTSPPSLKNAIKLDIDIKNNKILNSLDFIDTGPSESSTGECVEHVRKAIKNKNIDLNKAGKITNNMREALEREDIKKFNNSLRENENLLEEIGVVPEKVKNIIKDLEKKGLIAKISGAGSVRGDSAGIVVRCNI